MSQQVIHQLINGASSRDAITQNALLWQRWLQDAGVESELFALSITDDCQDKVRPWHRYPAKGVDGLLYHHSLGSSVVPELINQHADILVPVYHNVTPPHWFAGSQPDLAQRAANGIEQLNVLAQAVPAGIGVSEFNCADMRRAGFKRTEVIPITFDAQTYSKLIPIPPKIKTDGPILLFTGRFAPHKCQEDLVRLLYACRQFEPNTQLLLIGAHWSAGYTDWVRYVAEALGVADGVHAPGGVSFEELAGAYQAADVYVSLSEHEGFGMPLIESMFFELPVLAYRSSAVTDTLGGAGITFGEKNFAALAQLIIALWQDKRWQQRIVAGQSARVQDFMEERVKAKFWQVLGQLGLG